jgi:hypothetical protein
VPFYRGRERGSGGVERGLNDQRGDGDLMAE